MRTRVKICGITRLEDALAAVDAGADAVGFNLWPGSKRHVPLGRAAEIAPWVPPGVLRVGVFVRAPPEQVRAAVRALGLGAVQLHGDEEPADYADVGAPLWQVLRIGSSLPESVSERAAELLLDAKVDGFGGSGQSFDWSLARGARRFGLPFWLAGGLTADNVAEAVRRASPGGVDVASGVESSPGMKDVARVRAFVAAVRAAEER
ncbi:MAG TPA: phosphoribosylanthranilate isomerase [Myxococcaceae bacterium]|nr:phosphoribosylanthranilate isomerase [Myxococcaceae bacterium]